MIYFIVVWTLLAAICWVIGTAVLNALNAPEGTSWPLRAIAALWLGTILLAASLLAVSPVLSLSLPVGGAIAFLGLSLSLLSAETRREVRALRSHLSGRILLGFFALCAATAALMSKQVTWYDTGLYHFGAIRWLEKYGAVPGLALIHSKFGFISAWFAFAAPLNPESLGSRVTAVTNGFALLLACLQIAASLARIARGKAIIADGFATIFLVLAVFLMRFTPFMAAVTLSPSPDIPVILLTGVVAWVILLIARNEASCIYTPEPRTDARAIPLILGAGAVTMKLSALPLLGITGLFYLFEHRENATVHSTSAPFWKNREAVRALVKRGIKGSAIATVLLLPMVGVGYLTSGCPLYPSSVMCLDLPWALPLEKTLKERTAINGWLSWFGTPPAGANPFLWLFKEWWNLANFNKVMIGAIAVSVAIAVYTFKTVPFAKIRPLLWLLALGSSGILYIMTQAPLIRFGLGYFLLIPALLTAVYCEKIASHPRFQRVRERTFPLPTFQLGFWGLLLAGLALTLTLGDDLQASLILPPELPRHRVYEQQVNDIDYFLPVNSTKCWAAALPCTPEEISPAVRLRDSARGFDAGFINRKRLNKEDTKPPSE